LLLSFFVFSACARDYSDFLHRNIFFIAYLFVTFLCSCLCICWGLQCSSSLEHQITHSVFVCFFFFSPKLFSCTRILLSMHVLSLLLFCVSSEDQDDLHYSSRFISTPSKKVGFR
jgi:hypothetical protein